MPGDANGDDNVDDTDYSIWRQQFGTMVDAGVNDAEITAAAFVDDVGDGYSATVLYDNLSVEAAGSGTPDAYRMKWRVVSEPDGLADWAAELDAYGDPVSLAELVTIDTAGLDDSYVQLAILGTAGLAFGAASGYQWLRDTRPPSAFSIEQPAVAGVLNEPEQHTITASWTDAQTPADLPNSPLRYDVRLATDEAPTDIVAEANGVEGLQVELGPVAAGDYFLSVEATDLAGNTLVASNGPLAVSTLRTVLFVTFNEFNVNNSNPFPPPFPAFGSIEAADYFCNECADIAGLLDWDGESTVFQAVMSTSTETAIGRAFPLFGTAVEDVLGGQIAADVADLFNGTLLATPILDEFGMMPPANADVWTGSLTNGAFSGGGCSDWSNTSGFGTVGRADSLTSTWLSDVNQSCSSAGRLYCLGAI